MSLEALVHTQRFGICRRFGPCPAPGGALPDSGQGLLWGRRAAFGLDCRPKHRRQTTFVCSTLLSHGHHAIHAERAVLTQFSTLVARCFACLWQFVNTLRRASRPARVGCRWLPLQQPPSVAWRNSHPRFTLLRLPMSRHGEIASKVGGPGGSLRYVGGRGDLCALFDCCLTTIINILLYDNVGKHDNQIMLTIL